MIGVSFSILYIVSILIVDSSLTQRSDEIKPILYSGSGGYGSWTNWIYCNFGNYSDGFRMKIDPNDGGDNTAANGFQLHCNNDETIDAGSSMPWGTWTDVSYCGDSAAIYGFESQVQGKCSNWDRTWNSCDDSALNSIRVYCTNNKEPVIETPHAKGSWGPIGDCEYGSAVCGYKQMIDHCTDDSGIGKCDRTALNAVELACCTTPKTYNNNVAYWNTIYTGDSGVSFTQTITVGITHYDSSTFTTADSASLQESCSVGMSFKGISGTSSLTHSASQTVTETSVSSCTTVVTVQDRVSCISNLTTQYYGLYQFVVSSEESGLNHDKFRFDTQTGSYWCSTNYYQAPQCPPQYCNLNDNCQTCVGEPFQN